MIHHKSSREFTPLLSPNEAIRVCCSANSGQEPYFLICRAAIRVTFIADLRTMRVCVHVCTADTYDSRSDRSDHIYHEIGVENHSSANSGQS